MDELIKSIRRLIETSRDKSDVDKFARGKYYEKFPNRSREGFHYYDGFEIVSEIKIRVNYKYGAGEYEYDGSFVVDLTPEQRDGKIDKIIE